MPCNVCLLERRIRYRIVLALLSIPGLNTTDLLYGNAMRRSHLASRLSGDGNLGAGPSLNYQAAGACPISSCFRMAMVSPSWLSSSLSRTCLACLNISPSSSSM